MSVKKVSSLVMVRKEKKLLLGFKLRGFGAGKWEGFGGKLEANETIYECAQRELKEECGLTAKNLRKIGVLHVEFESYKGDPLILETHVFDTFSFEGHINETQEMQPKWFNLSDVPYDKMWPDFSLWIPYMLKERLFKAYFLYRGEETLIEYNIEEVTKVP